MDGIDTLGSAAIVLAVACAIVAALIIVFF